MSLKKISTIIVGALFTSSLFAATCQIDGQAHGDIEFKSGMTIMNLNGSYREMGYCYGKLAGSQMQQFYQTVSKQINYDGVLDRFLLLVSKVTLPRREKELFKGISQGSGINYNEVIKINFATDLFFLNKSRTRFHLAGTGCSVMMASGNRSKNNHTLIGRNYDIPHEFFASFAPYTAIVTYHPEKEFHENNQLDHAVTTIGYLGMIAGVSAVNDHSLFNEINSGLFSFPFPRINLFALPDPMMQNFEAMLDSDSLSDLNHYYQHHLIPAAVMIAVADPHMTYHFERTPFQYGKMLQLDENNQIHREVASNRFDIFTNTMALKWFGMAHQYSPEHDTPTQAYERLTHLQNLAKQQKLLTVESLKKLMVLPIAEGGAFQVNQDGRTETTAYTLVMDINSRKLWLFVPGKNSQWLEYSF